MPYGRTLITGSFPHRPKPHHDFNQGVLIYRHSISTVARVSGSQDSEWITGHAEQHETQNAPGIIPRT